MSAILYTERGIRHGFGISVNGNERPTENQGAGEFGTTLPRRVAAEIDTFPLRSRPAVPVTARCGLRTLPVEAAQVAKKEGSHESGRFLQAGGEDGPARNQTLESTVALAAKLPVLKRIGDRMGSNFDDAESGEEPDRKGQAMK